MRLIDADALQDAMYHEAFETYNEMQRWDSGCWIRYKLFENILNNAPTIDAELVRHGEWIKHPDPTIRDYDVCTACGIGTRRRTYGFNTDGTKWVEEVGFPRCPNCGAKMDKE